MPAPRYFTGRKIVTYSFTLFYPIADTFVRIPLGTFGNLKEDVSAAWHPVLQRTPSMLPFAARSFIRPCVSLGADLTRRSPPQISALSLFAIITLGLMMLIHIWMIVPQTNTGRMSQDLALNTIGLSLQGLQLLLSFWTVRFGGGRGAVLRRAVPYCCAC